MNSTTDSADTDPRSITRPHSSLLTYYILVSASALIAFPVVFFPPFIRFKTLHYRFDEEGVAMSWGLLFHREVYLTYRRIQDIHVTRNIVERWMGLAKVRIQTASGTSGATMNIEGIRNPEPLRDFLYERLRGARAQNKAIMEGIDNPTEVHQLIMERVLRSKSAGLGDEPLSPPPSSRNWSTEHIRALRQILDEVRTLK